MQKKWFLSSNNNGDLALTIKGALVALIPLIIIAGKYFQVDIAEEQISTVIGAIVGIIAGIQIIVGVVRKIVTYFSERQS